MTHATPAAVEAFITRWSAAGGSERANYQLFLTELTELLGLPRPDPAGADTADNAYVFERRVIFAHGDGTSSNGFIDLFRRGAFVCEAKQTGEALGSGKWDNSMLRARGQAESYARALPAAEGRPPFLIVTDVGRNIELYAEFSRSGATYTPFPDARSHRIKLEDLRREEIRERLIKVWLDPLALDPTRQSARVTREIAAQLALLAKSLEASGQPSDAVASFLMRALFTMFAEDVGLLPAECFKTLLEECEQNPAAFVPLVGGLWQDMNTGHAFSATIRARVLRFNGGLFANASVLPLDKHQIKLLREAARADWRFVEPAIFGTLLERALDPTERHALGAHYTPRAYVERLVLPTVIEPLRADWKNAQAAAALLDAQGKHDEAVKTLRAFHHQLCSVRVLDPACGSGNFLYVTLEHMKRLEGEVLGTLEEFGETQSLLQMEGISVDPHQFLGLELNPRAARIAEAVLWIGYLQWHFRTYGNVSPPEPVLRDFHNIECRDAVLAFDRIDYVLGDDGQPVTRWDGVTTKTHPVTGEQVPDESARVPLENYANPRRADWPQADFVVGNPPFIGCKKMRAALGDGYVDALRGVWNDVPESADFVMYWWHQAALLALGKQVRRFGFITTNSLTQIFNRRVVSSQLDAGLTLAFAIPDHPWVDAADGAAVRISMTVGEACGAEGKLFVVNAEQDAGGEGVEASGSERNGRIFADLSIGANIAGAGPLLANSRLTSNGVMLAGAGFIVSPEEAAALGLGRIPGLEQHIRPYRNGKDLLDAPRGAYVIDLFGLQPDEIRTRFPEVYQWVVERVKAERDHNNRAKFREKWWEFGEPRKLMRAFLAGLDRYVATVETCKHRLFVMLGGEFLADHRLIVAGFADMALFGVLTSRVHVQWALAAGGTLEDRPVYNKTRCYDTFPFPDLRSPDEGASRNPGSDARSTITAPDSAGAASGLRERIAQLAEQIDAHRKRQQAAHPGLTLTGMYNVLERLRQLDAGLDTTPLNAKEKTIHEHGLVSILRELHDALDAAVLAAYGWSDLAPALVGAPGGTTPLADKPATQAAAEEELLTRLVALNAQRAREEAQGHIRWLRPEFQAPNAGQAPVEQGELEGTQERDQEQTPAAAPSAKTPWPKSLPEQVQALRASLTAAGVPLGVEALASRFKGAKRERVAEVLDTLVALGQLRREGEAYGE